MESTDRTRCATVEPELTIGRVVQAGAAPALQNSGHESSGSRPCPVAMRTIRAAMAARETARHHHHVYVVELSDRVWSEPAFRRAHPDYVLGKPFVYVGMTGLDADLRFDRHKAGVQADRFVLQYGLRLIPQLYEVYNPMPYQAALEVEVELAIGLREAGYGVWQALRANPCVASDSIG